MENLVSKMKQRALSFYVRIPQDFEERCKKCLSSVLPTQTKDVSDYEGIALQAIDYTFPLHFLAYNGLQIQTIKEKRRKTYNALLQSVGLDKNSDFSTVQEKINKGKFTEKLIDAYSTHYFTGHIGDVFKSCYQGRKIVVCWNNKCTSAGGKTRKIGETIKIDLSSHVLSRLLSQGPRKIRTGGLTCKTLIKCAMITFEHELVHGIIQISDTMLGGKGYPQNVRTVGNWKGLYNNASGHSITFMSIVNNVFGHTSYTHQILERLQKYSDKIKHKYAPDELGELLQRGSKIKGYTVFGMYNDDDTVLSVEKKQVVNGQKGKYYTYDITDVDENTLKKHAPHVSPTKVIPAKSATIIGYNNQRIKLTEREQMWIFDPTNKKIIEDIVIKINKKKIKGKKFTVPHTLITSKPQ